MTTPINNGEDPIDWDNLITPKRDLYQLAKETILITLIVFTMILFWGTFIAGINALWLN